jgi:type II secretory ATPase GspE/PulE/Tfp pilus assembly ATPase PilB-like protein
VSSIELGASDIHIEETKTYVQIRFRKDGDFIIHDRLDHQNYSSLITRLKVLSRIKIDENKKPQDGKISFYYEKEKEDIDVRLSTFPTKYGEKVVMRLLRQDESLINIDKLGFIDVNLHRIKEALKSKYGIILVA